MCKADVLWYISRTLKSLCPSWSGTMQMIHTGDFPGQSSFLFLPMIDLDPGDLSCIYSTLQYISSHARRHNVSTVVTFHQPLWLKAVTLWASDNAISSIINLGGFHRIMSFLGAIGCCYVCMISVKYLALQVLSLLDKWISVSGATGFYTFIENSGPSFRCRLGPGYWELGQLGALKSVREAT